LLKDHKYFIFLWQLMSSLPFSRH